MRLLMPLCTVLVTVERSSHERQQVYIISVFFNLPKTCHSQVMHSGMSVLFLWKNFIHHFVHSAQFKSKDLMFICPLKHLNDTVFRALNIIFYFRWNKNRQTQSVTMNYKSEQCESVCQTVSFLSKQCPTQKLLALPHSFDPENNFAW